MALITAHHRARERHARARPRPVQAQRRPALGRAGLRRPVVLAAEARAGRVRRRDPGARHRRDPDDAARRARRRSPAGAATESLYDFNLATYDEGDTFDQSLAKGFVELWGLPSKIAASARPAARPATVDARGRDRDDGHRRAGAAVGRPVRRRAGRRAGRAVQVDALRLGAGAVRPRRVAGARAGAAPGGPARPTTSCAGCSAAWTSLEADVRRRRVPRRPSTDEDVHSALERGLIERVGADLGGKLRAGRSRNDQVATLFRLWLRDAMRAASPTACSTSSTRWSTQAARAPRRAIMPGKTHLQHAAAGAAGHHLLAHAHAAAARRRPAARLGRAGRGLAATARARWPARRCGLDPEAVAAELGFDAAASTTRSTPPPPATSPPSSAFVSAMIGVRPVPARPRRSSSGAPREFGYVDAATTRGRPGQLDHAAEEEPGHRRAGPRQVRPADRQPDRPAGHAQGRSRWPTTATCRRTRSRCSTRSTQLRAAAAGDGRAWSRTLAFDTERMAALAPLGFTLATDVAEWLVRAGRAVPGGARGGRGLRPRVRGPAASSCGTSPTTTWRDSPTT